MLVFIYKSDIQLSGFGIYKSFSLSFHINISKFAHLYKTNLDNFKSRINVENFN